MVRIHGFASVPLWFVFVSIAMGQQTGVTETPKKAQGSSSHTLVRSNVVDISNNARIVQTRTESAGRSVTRETMEMPGIDGKFMIVRESISETVGIGSESVHTDRRVFGTDADGRRQLIETGQVDENVLADGTERTVENTWVPDLNGRQQLSHREVTETRSPSANVTETNVSFYLPGINEPVEESRRIRHIERQVSKNVVRNESTRYVRDGNSRWKTDETRTLEIRETETGSTEEETVQQLSATGVLATAERIMTRRSSANGQKSAVTEIYSQASAGPMGQLELNRRIRVTTMVAADGSEQTIQELERPYPLGTNGPLRVVERTVETVRPLGSNQSETERQVFNLDVNGRFLLVMTEQEQATVGSP